MTFLNKQFQSYTYMYIVIVKNESFNGFTNDY